MTQTEMQLVQNILIQVCLVICKQSELIFHTRKLLMVSSLGWTSVWMWREPPDCRGGGGGGGAVESVQTFSHSCILQLAF